MTNIAQDISQLLRDSGFEPVYTDYAPEYRQMPYFDICVFGYGGEATDLHWDGEYPRVQIVVRSNSYDEGNTKIQEIYRLLHGKSEFRLGSARYLLLQALQSPCQMKRDDRGLIWFVFNLRSIREFIRGGQVRVMTDIRVPRLGKVVLKTDIKIEK